MANDNSVSYMKEYLRHAVEFEKYVYIWSKANDEVNDRMSQIFSEHERLESTNISTRNLLATLEDKNEIQRKYKENESARFRKKSRTMLIIMITIIVILLILGLCIGFALLNDPHKSANFPRGAIIPTVVITVVLIGSVFPPVLPICLGLFVSYKSKAVRFGKEAMKLTNQASSGRQRMILEAKKSEIESDLIFNAAEESEVSKKKEKIHAALTEAKCYLEKIYSVNVLPPKYRNLVAVVTLYEYLVTGRCNAIQGHGGIYDTYEVEKIHLAQLQQMFLMNETLIRMEDNQRYICQELQQANRTLSGIHNSLKEIERSNAVIAENTAISAAADQQTAAAAKWMAWNTWASGY